MVWGYRIRRVAAAVLRITGTGSSYVVMNTATSRPSGADRGARRFSRQAVVTRKMNVRKPQVSAAARGTENHSASVLSVPVQRHQM